MYLPDDVSTVPPLTWEACPFQDVGCERIPSPWYKTPMTGFVRLFTLAGAGEPLIAVGREATETDEEVLVQQGSKVLYAFRVHIPSSRCVMSVPKPWGDRYTSIVMRLDNDPSPVVLDWAQTSQPDAPGAVTTYAFGPPAPGLLPTRNIVRNGDAIVIEEAGARFTVRDLASGNTWRPKLQPAEGLYYPALWGRNVMFQYRTSTKAWLSYASLDAPGEVAHLVAPTGSKVLWPAVGGSPSGAGYVAWTLGTNEVSVWTFSKVELWGSPLAPGSVALSPKKLRDLPTKTQALLSTGDGWTVALLDSGDILLVPWDGGPGRRLAAVPGMPWFGEEGDVVVRDGFLWIFAQGKYPVEGARYLVKLEIASLPPE